MASRTFMFGEKPQTKLQDSALIWFTLLRSNSHTYRHYMPYIVQHEEDGIMLILSILVDGGKKRCCVS